MIPIRCRILEKPGFKEFIVESEAFSYASDQRLTLSSEELGLEELFLSCSEPQKIESLHVKILMVGRNDSRHNPDIYSFVARSHSRKGFVIIVGKVNFKNSEEDHCILFLEEDLKKDPFGFVLFG